MHAYKGTMISPGIEIAPCYQFTQVALAFRRYRPSDPTDEWIRFESAVSKAGHRLTATYEQAVAALGPEQAAIFHAHLTILTDPELLGGVRSMIFDEGANAEAALFDVSEGYSCQLEAMEDEYIRARAADIRDVRDQVLQVLLGIANTASSSLNTPSIVVSRCLTPSDCISMDRRMLRGFCTLEGGTTSHVAILARSLGIPAITGVDEAVLRIGTGSTIILDGEAAALVCEADAASLRGYEQKRAARARLHEEAKAAARLPAVTLDGHQVQVLANLGTADGDAVQACLQNGAEGVGLLRTEFVYLECVSMPDEELQYQKYRAITEAFGKSPIILRTIDIGGDKELPYFQLPHELNPFLGVRGLRLSLRNPAMFKAQLRAALRAGFQKNLRLMFPMVTKASEIREARAILDEVKRELKAESAPFAEDIEVGIMVEVPAAAILADKLAAEVDFFSIGTNDLSQYTMAMDRTNTELNAQVDGLDPAVLRLISGVIEAGHRKGRSVGVCGELAGEPLAIPILVGFGLDEFSMNSPAIPTAKKVIRSLRMADAKAIAERVLQFESGDQVRRFVAEQLPDMRTLFSG